MLKVTSREKAALRELAKLHHDGLTSSTSIAASRKPDRDPTLPSRVSTLFHGKSAVSEMGCGGGRRLVPVHSEPPLYVVPNFLSPKELDHFDELLTRRRAAFKISHTDGDGEALVSQERTSISLALPKSGDAVLRTIEARAAELVGLPSDHVEPLQIVHYSQGARFDMHHDLAPIKVEGEETEANGSAVEGGSSSCDGGSEDRVAAPLSAGSVTVESADGPRRLVTLFVYLNTLPEGVGHTEFPLLRGEGGAPFSVRPRCGTALVFCNVSANGEADVRLCHRACPVPDEHVKFGVNIWVSDVSQQAHALEAPKIKGPMRSGAQNGKGILAPLLFTEPSDLPPPPAAALLGLTFRKRFGRLGTFSGTVAAHDSQLATFRVEYDDGDEEDLEADALLLLPLAEPKSLVGRRLSRHFAGYGRFEGQVTSYDDASGFEVTYEDGDIEDNLAAPEVLRLLMPPLKPKKRKRGGAGGPTKAKAASKAADSGE